MADHKLRVAYGQLTRAQLNAGTGVIVGPSAGRTLKVVDGWVRAIGGAVGTATGVQLVDSFMHLAADATTLAATVPAVSEAESYALSIELIADHNTHTASTAYHRKATAAVTSTAATTEATLIAQVNKMRTAALAHYLDTDAHGGMADLTRYNLVAATTIATTRGHGHRPREPAHHIPRRAHHRDHGVEHRARRLGACGLTRTPSCASARPTPRPRSCSTTATSPAASSS